MFHLFCIYSIFLVAKEFARSSCLSECRILDEYRAGSHFQTSDSRWISNLYFQHSRSHDIEILLSKSCPDNLFVALEGRSFQKAIHFEIPASLKWNKVTIVKVKLVYLKDFSVGTFNQVDRHKRHKHRHWELAMTWKWPFISMGLILGMCVLRIKWFSVHLKSLLRKREFAYVPRDDGKQLNWIFLWVHACS